MWRCSKQYGRICAPMAMQRWLDRQKSPAFKRPLGKRIRLGIVSADIRLHSVWMALIKGWIQSLDLERFELDRFLVGKHRADGRDILGSRQYRISFVGGSKGSFQQWVAALREQNCEILLYPAVGLHPMALKLARPAFGAGPDQHLGPSRHLRRADTRLLCIRGVLSSSANAQDHYSETARILAPPRQPHTAVGPYKQRSRFCRDEYRSK